FLRLPPERRARCSRFSDAMRCDGAGPRSGGDEGMVRIDLEERSRTLPGGLLRRFGAALFVMCAYLATSTIASATIVLLEARNPESLARFYEDQVGLTVLVRDAEARRTVLGIGDDWLVIAPGGEGESRSAPRILIPVQDLAAAR